MAANRTDSFRLFRVAGIDVSIHWSWFLVAVYELNSRKDSYDSLAWNVAEYLSLFVIILLHEFGHAFACRQTGGKSDHITLWPLGGIAFVQPPPRAGALLWSIAAGPLVNVALIPVLAAVRYAMHDAGLLENAPDLEGYLATLVYINILLLKFNLLPIYPLDGGQILRALLWFIVGRAKSLLVASVIGMLGGAAMVGYAFYRESIWYGILAAFALQQCWRGFKHAKVLSKLEMIPRHDGFTCPECCEPPFQGEHWACECGARFDTFSAGSICPQCNRHFEKTSCPMCGQSSESGRWKIAL